MVLWQMGLGCQVQIRWQIGGTPNPKGAYVIQPQNNSTTVMGYHEIPD
jgi:hypothetical protein